MEPFLIRALAAGLGLAIIAAPLGCFLVWQRMAFFGETVAQASLIGVALALALNLHMTGAVLATALMAAGLLVLLGRQRVVPLDALLSLLAHGALAAGVLVTALVKGPNVDLMGFLFGDILAVSREDLLWLAAIAAAVLLTLARLWQPLLSAAVHADIAAAEGVDTERVRAIFMLLLALVIAIAMKVVGILLTVAFLIIPAAAARPLSSTPEQMMALAALFSAAGVIAGLGMSWGLDVPGGPSIVVVLAAFAGLSLSLAAWRRR